MGIFYLIVTLAQEEEAEASPSALRSPSAKAGVEGRKALEGIPVDGFAGGHSMDRAQTAPGTEGHNSCDVKDKSRGTTEQGASMKRLVILPGNQVALEH